MSLSEQSAPSTPMLVQSPVQRAQNKLHKHRCLLRLATTTDRYSRNTFWQPPDAKPPPHNQPVVLFCICSWSCSLSGVFGFQLQKKKNPNQTKQNKLSPPTAIIWKTASKASSTLVLLYVLLLGDDIPQHCLACKI